MDRKTKEFKFGVHVKAIIFDYNENVLTLKRLKDGKEEWDLPGGQVKFGENVYNAVWRIVKEQTDLDVDIEGPSNVWTLKLSEYLHTICISFRCTWFSSAVPGHSDGNESDNGNNSENFGGHLDDNDDEDVNGDTDGDVDSDESDDPIFLSTEFSDYEWVSPEKILDGQFPIWMKDEMKIIEDE